MYYEQKKLIIKNIIFIIVILTIAIVATYNIYYHFIDATSIDYSSESLEIVFHEKDGAKVTLTKAIPVSDSVGLSSSSYTFTIKNNLTEPVSYQVKLIEDIKTVAEDLCGEYQLPKDLLRVSIKETNEKTMIYTLSELSDYTLDIDTLDALEEKDYSIRIWLNNSIPVSIGSDLHYHGIIKVIENNSSLEIK